MYFFNFLFFVIDFKIIILKLFYIKIFFFYYVFYFKKKKKKVFTFKTRSSFLTNIFHFFSSHFREFPNCQFHGIDVEPNVPDLVYPKNCFFEQGDYLKKLPYQSNTFDVVRLTLST